jgi:DNA-binding NtrC family response regulator
LGLATVQGIVSQNDGFVIVESEQGSGTTFQVHLPRCEEEIDERAPVGEPERRESSEQVLLVEDDEMVRKLTHDMLVRMGHRVLLAASAGEAMTIFEEHEEQIDLLITDVVLPGRSGRELRDALTERRPTLKTLYMSGYTADIISKRGVLEHGVQFLQKPFGIEELSRKIREILDPSTAPPTR